MSIVNNLHPMNSSTGEGSSQVQFNEKVILNINRLNSYGMNTDTISDLMNVSLKSYANITLASQTSDINVTDNIEKEIFKDDIGDKTIPANYFEAGQTLAIDLMGHITTTSSAGTLIIKVKLGSTTLVTSPTVTLANNLTDSLFLGKIFINCRSIGATGTVFCHGFIDIDKGSNSFDRISLVTPSTITIDTTIAQETIITATMNLASGNNIHITAGHIRKL